MKNKINNKPQGDYIQIYNMLKELFISAYKWENLPLSINQRFLEISLFDYGRVAFFKDEVMNKYLALKSTNAGPLNVYFEPTNIRAFGGNGYQKQLTNHKDCVIVYNNFVRDTSHIRVIDFAKRIWNIERTIDINIHAQKTPILLTTSKKMEFTVKNLYQQYDDFKPAIVVDSGLDHNAISSVNTTAPYIADKLEEQKRRLWNEILSYAGIENNFSEKNERLTKNEVLVSNGLAIANRNAKLHARKEAVKEINTMFGLDISVRVNNLSLLEMDGEVDEQL